MAPKPPKAVNDQDMNPTSTKKTQAAGQRRSRTGCITCKIRRVKCDETRPLCERCISTGRTCDGYPSAGTPSQHQTRRALAAAVRQLQVAGPASRVLGKPLPIDDVACFDFFRLCTASMTGSVFPGEKFWSRQMLQAAHIEPAAWRAVVALGALHRRWEYSNNCLSTTVTRRGCPNMAGSRTDVNIFTQQATRHYAVSLSLAKAVSDPAMLIVISVALAAAAHLGGKWADSQVHIRAGLRLLREMQTAKTAIGTGAIILLQADLEGAAQALERLDAQAMTLSDATSPYEYTENDLKESKLILVNGSILPDDYPLQTSASRLIGPMNDLGQAALAIFRLIRQFFITADAVTTGTLTPYEFELARLQMVEATSQWENELGVLIDVAESKFRFANDTAFPRHKSDQDQKILILSLKLYHTTVELMLLAHGEAPQPACVQAPAGEEGRQCLSFRPVNLATESSLDTGPGFPAGPSFPIVATYSGGFNPPTYPSPRAHTAGSPPPRNHITGCPPPRAHPRVHPTSSPSPGANTLCTSVTAKPADSSSDEAVIGFGLSGFYSDLAFHKFLPPESLSFTHFPPAALPQADASNNHPPPKNPVPMDPLHDSHPVNDTPPSFCTGSSSAPSPSPAPSSFLFQTYAFTPDTTTPTPHNIPDNDPPQSNPNPTSQPPDHTIPTDEARWDALHHHFLQIVSLASEIAQNTDSPLPFFMSLEPGLAMPLYLTVKRCRHPITRRRALGLLRRLNRQEGIWNCALAARAAEELIFLEEGGILNKPNTNTTSPPTPRNRAAEDRTPVNSTPENLLLPLDFFEKHDREEADEGLLSQFREHAVQRFQWLHQEECLRKGRDVDAEVMAGGYTGQPFPQPYWGDGWPNIPESKRVLVQYPIIRMERNQLELMMFLVGDTEGGRGKMAKRVVVDMF